MKFSKTPIPGAYIIDLESISDERGFFARAYCAAEFQDHGLPAEFVQANMSENVKKGTIRGLHYQLPPHEEAKFMRAIRGEIFNVIVDVRSGFATYGKWFGIKLNETNNRALFVPQGCANGYQALTDGACVLYTTTATYHPKLERGIRWNDPAIGIKWPITQDVIVSPKDQAFADFLISKT